MLKRFAAFVLVSALCSATSFAAQAEKAAAPASGCNGISIQQMFASLPKEKQDVAQQLFATYAESIHKRLRAEQDARKSLDVVLLDPAATPEAVEQKTRSLIERQSDIIKERVAFRMKLAAETGIRLPFRASGAGGSTHGTGCGDDGDCPADRNNTAK